jgi:uncharacterized protein YktB (UPF0637 family)
MVSFDEHYECFKLKIRWCNKEIASLERKISDNLTNEKLKTGLNRVTEYKRNCNIICRLMQVHKNKTMNDKPITQEEKDKLKEQCLELRFRKFRNLQNYLSLLD